jgi:high-affinity iron transporter
MSGGKVFALGVVAFTAVFREVFETVLFLRALLLDVGTEQQWAVLSGVAISFALVLVVAAVLLRYSVRIPIRQLFHVSSLVLVLLCFIMMGKALHSFQETGLLSATAIDHGLRFDWLGIFPTFETIVGQCLTLILSVGLWLWGRQPPLLTDAEAGV